MAFLFLESPVEPVRTGRSMTSDPVWMISVVVVAIMLILVILGKCVHPLDVRQGIPEVNLLIT